MKRLLMLLLCLSLLLTPALAVAPWALDGLCEAESLGFLTAADLEQLEETVTETQLEAICAAVGDKLALLGQTARPHTDTVRQGDFTRNGVLSALYDVAARYEFEGVSEGALPFLAGLNVVRGNEAGEYQLDRPCTRQETFLFAQRLVLALYDRENAGTSGLMWRVEQGGNTLYLFGTYHADRNNLYPLHSTVREAVSASDTVCLEVDFGDTAGVQEMLALYYYPQGDGLSNYLDETTYRETVAALAPFGYDEATVHAMKMWAVGNALSAAANMDETTNAAMVTDVYVYSKALCNGKTVEQVESYGQQGALFDGLSRETQLDMVRSGLELLSGTDTEVDGLFAPWQTGDLTAFETALDKDAPAETEAEAEMMQALFTERDRNMTAWCEEFLHGEGARTALFTVGAGHMVGKTGVVAALRDAGYTVTQIVK